MSVDNSYAFRRSTTTKQCLVETNDIFRRRHYDRVDEQAIDTAADTRTDERDKWPKARNKQIQFLELVIGFVTGSRLRANSTLIFAIVKSIRLRPANRF